MIRCAAAVLGIAVATGLALAQSRGDPARGAVRSAACGSCHGSTQSPPAAGMPALAGQPDQFLVLQMFLLREGLREVPPMAGMLKGLTDRDLEDMAAYFARLPPPPPPGSNARPDPTLHARGAALARAMGCGSCHLHDYRGQQQVPRLGNQREDYLVASMKAYRDNTRTGTDTNMNGIMYRLTDSDIQALAHYLAHQ